MKLCEICRKEFNTQTGLSGHIVKIHKLKRKDYYDKYLKKENEGKCLTCGKETKFTEFKKGYQKFCCMLCCNSDLERKEKIKRTFLKKYGVDHPSKCKEVKEKRKQTIIKKNFENLNRLKEIGEKTRQTFLKKYKENINYFKEIQEKKEKTCLRKYKIINPLQLKEVRIKKEKTCLKNYGVKNPLQSPLIKEKIRQTCLKKYGETTNLKNKENIEKQKQTLLNKYGVDNYSKTHQFRELARYNKIKQIESQLQNGQKIDPKEGKNENQILNELQNKTNTIILRKQSIGGLFPDGIEENFKIIIELDEPYHLIKCYQNHDRIKDEYYQLKGYNIFRISEKEWFKNKQLIIEQFKQLIHYLEKKQQLILKPTNTNITK